MQLMAYYIKGVERRLNGRRLRFRQLLVTFQWHFILLNDKVLALCLFVTSSFGFLILYY